MISVLVGAGLMLVGVIFGKVLGDFHVAEEHKDHDECYGRPGPQGPPGPTGATGFCSLHPPVTGGTNGSSSS